MVSIATAESGHLHELGDKYLSWFRIQRAVAWLLKFCEWKLRSPHTMPTALTELTYDRLGMGSWGMYSGAPMVANC